LEKTCPSATLSTTKSHMTRPGLEPRSAAVGSQRLTAWAMARLLHGDLWRFKKEVVVVYPGTCLEQLREITNTLIRTTLLQGRDLNPVSSEDEWKVLPTSRTFSVYMTGDINPIHFSRYDLSLPCQHNTISSRWSLYLGRHISAHACHLQTSFPVIIFASCSLRPFSCKLNEPAAVLCYCLLHFIF
jgi:hypothetical protein